MRPHRFHRASIRCALILPLLAGANLVSAQSGTASITLQPVPPKTIPPSSYPPGTTIVGQEIILGSVPARVWLEIHVTGWAPEILRVVQATISATDLDGDGGGYFGANADCMSLPAVGAGNLVPAMHPCPSTNSAGNLVCRENLSGLAAPCQYGEPSRCESWDGAGPNFFPAGRFCVPGFQDRCDSEWAASGIAATPAVGIDGLDFRYGFAANPGQMPLDFAPSYIGTLVLDVPANAKGTYTIDFDESQTFLENPNNPPNNNIPIGALYPAKITVPCGRCCYGVGTASTQCVEAVSANECAAYAASAVFQADEVCPESGGSACPACALDEHCDDGVFCNGAEVCDAGGMCGPGEPPCEAYEACEEDTDSCAPRIPAINVWGMLAMTILLLIASKLRYRRMPPTAFDRSH